LAEAQKLFGNIGEGRKSTSLGNRTQGIYQFPEWIFTVHEYRNINLKQAMALIFQFSSHDHPSILFDVKYSVQLMQCRENTHELSSHESDRFVHIVAYLLKARTVEPEKEPLLGNART
jgi:hypothetical protein